MKKAVDIEVDVFLNRLKISQMQKLIDRYQLKFVHIMNFRKRNDMEKTLAKYMKTTGIGECPICFEPNKYMIAVATPCAHIFCDKCLIEHLKKSNVCPMCRDSVDMNFIMNQLSTHRFLKLNSTMKKEEVIEEYIEDNHIPLDFIVVDQIDTVNVTASITSIIVVYSYIRTSFLTLCAVINVGLTLLVVYQICVIVYYNLL
jgi:hypothetical protein